MDINQYGIADKVQKAQRRIMCMQRYKTVSKKYQSFVKRGLIKPSEPIQLRRGSSVAYGTWPERPNW